jgi:TolB protein
VDVAVHGNGLISLQYREVENGPTHEIQVIDPGSGHRPQRLALERQGEVFLMSLNTEGETGSRTGEQAAPLLKPCGAFHRVPSRNPLFVGLGVCAHDDSKLEKARFTDVLLRTQTVHSAEKPALHCTLETVGISSKDRRVIYHSLEHIEAPNWSRDGKFLLFNCRGGIYRLPLEGGKPVPIDTGFAQHCNNDHGISPDGKLLVISDQSRGNASLIYILPLAGGIPRLITKEGPSYWHGWSPDGLSLAYCAERNGEFDVYAISAEGGEEKRLTTAKGLDDGPDYTPDGNWIYFNSERTGTMQIWRMKADGSQQEQVTMDEFNNWFPHPSPDGKWIVFLSYDKGVTGHPANQPVRLRLMPLTGGGIQELARLFGGQGTLNVPCWSPDSRQIAFVSYELLRSD